VLEGTKVEKMLFVSKKIEKKLQKVLFVSNKILSLQCQTKEMIDKQSN
jgi:hypothetical protein